MNYLFSAAADIVRSLFGKPTLIRNETVFSAADGVYHEIMVVLLVDSIEMAKTKSTKIAYAKTSEETQLKISTIYEAAKIKGVTDFEILAYGDVLYGTIAETNKGEKAIVFSGSAIPRKIGYHADYCVAYLAYGKWWRQIHCGEIQHDDDTKD